MAITIFRLGEEGKEEGVADQKLQEFRSCRMERTDLSELLSWKKGEESDEAGFYFKQSRPARKRAGALEPRGRKSGNRVIL